MAWAADMNRETRILVALRGQAETHGGAESSITALGAVDLSPGAFTIITLESVGRSLDWDLEGRADVVGVDAGHRYGGGGLANARAALGGITEARGRHDAG